MIIPDVNLLIYAYISESRQHAAAEEWWEQALGGEREEIGLAWIVVLGFLRIATNRKALTRPMSVDQATGLVRSWLRQETVRTVVPGEEHSEILFGLLEKIGTAGNLTTDAHLAALALEYGAKVATTDADFARFTGVKWFNPLV